MKFLSPLTARLLVLLACLWTWSPVAHAAGVVHPCHIDSLSPGATLDIPFGQVAFSTNTMGTVAQISPPPFDVNCDPSDFNGSGKNPMLIRASMPVGTSYEPTTRTWSIPTGDSNLKVEVQLVSSNPMAAPSGANPYDLVSLSLGVQTWSNVTFAVRLVKYGVVDASRVSLPVTVELYNSKDGNSASADIATVRIGSGTSIRSLSCLAKDVTVTLPTVTTADLSGSDQYSNVTAPIPIEVSGCPAGTRLSVALTGTPAAGKFASSGIVQSTGTEPNVAVQVIDENGDPVDISGGTSMPMGQTPPGGGPVSITYYARYYALRPAQGGRVKATLTYTLSYP